MRVRFAILVVTAFVILPTAPHAQLITHRDLSLQMALTIATSALEICGQTTSIAVVDRGGRVRVLLEGDNASPHNAELARRKAYTARTFRAPSADWAKRTETANQGQRELTDVIPLGGGMPIKVGDDTIGGVGLSGATGGQPMEEKCANAGIAKVAEHLK
jgi:uncharacterized protein GlcG (DUF336 family)